MLITVNVSDVKLKALSIQEEERQTVFEVCVLTSWVFFFKLHDRNVMESNIFSFFLLLLTGQ